MLQNVDNNVSDIHQHVTNEVFQGQGKTVKVNTHAILGLFLDEAENQRRTKRPRMSGFKATRRGVEAIKKIRERELHCLEAMVGAPSTSGPRVTRSPKPFDLPLLFERI